MNVKSCDNGEPKTLRINRFPFLDNIHTTIFTPSEHQVELLDAAKQKDIVVCLASSTSQTFIVIMLIKELAYQVRGPEKTTKRSIIAVNNEAALQQYLEMVRDHSDLKVAELSKKESVCLDEKTLLEMFKDNSVVVTYVEHLLEAIRTGYLNLSVVNLLVVDECQLAVRCHPCRDLLSLAQTRDNGVLLPRILGLSTSVLGSTCDPIVLEERLSRLERCTKCVADTSSGLVLLSRYSSWPEEIVIECGNCLSSELDSEIKNLVSQATKYLLDHVYRPEELYGMFDDDVSSIPDPTVVPLAFLSDLVYILDTLGAWCADRAAWFFMKELKKHKDKTPYERHYLLLSVVYTVMEAVRAICDYHFKGMEEKERMIAFASPKVLRLIEIIKFYKPPPPPESDQSKIDGCNKNVDDQCADQLERKCSNNCCKISSNCDNNKDDEITSEECDNCKSQLDQSRRAVDVNDVGHSLTKNCHPSQIRNHSEVHHQHHHHHGYGRGFRTNFASSDGSRVLGGGPNGRSFTSNTFSSRVFNDDPNSLWSIVFVEKRYVACILNMYLKEASKQLAECRFVSPNFIMGRRQLPLSSDGTVDAKEAQLEHRKQEEVLRRFRTHECNVLVATSVVEEGVDLPKCNLVIRFDPPLDYRSYTQSKGRAKAIPSRFLLLIERQRRDAFLKSMSRFTAIEEILLNHCHSREVPVDEEVDLLEANLVVAPYRPVADDLEVMATMSSAISLVNRYCARLPSDTFTRLVPYCTLVSEKGFYRAEIRLPINSPVKFPIKGPLMSNVALAKMAAALETIKVLHRCGELDNRLLPVGKVCTRKEVFAAMDDDEEEEVVPEGAPRPGTTKRRQYYNKNTASAFKGCLPRPEKSSYLYHVAMKLTCPIPEEQNVRGRQIYEPANTSQGFGILTATKIPEICGFPVFTRSGEVRVKLVPIAFDLMLSKKELDDLYFFHCYTFSNVLRLEKYPMCFDIDAAENSIIIVPLNRIEKHIGYNIDWSFVAEIVSQKHTKPRAVPETERVGFEFNELLYRDAVVMPWYRNLDQPQYFYVAEVCRHLGPFSDFPDDDFETFEKYYFKKYGIKIQNLKQPLLDVDHTSARLNLLTPRYVNRKGVALPTSSEETKRAKRENLQQKQILVPELCTIHLFTASLWRKAVCLPCILYRLNCLLLAEELRERVAREIGLGQLVLVDDHRWPDLDFGWSLADVVKARKLAAEEKKEKLSLDATRVAEKDATNSLPTPVKPIRDSSQKMKRPRPGGNGSAFSIGTWSNEMAVSDTYDDSEDPDWESKEMMMLNDGIDLLPNNLMLLNDGGDFHSKNVSGTFLEEEDEEELSALSFDSSERQDNNLSGTEETKMVRYGSPSNFEDGGWDIDNDVEFDVMDIPGFGFISAPGGGFNMEDLSRDLEAYEAKLYSPQSRIGSVCDGSRRSRVHSRNESYDDANIDDDDDDDDDIDDNEVDDSEVDAEQYWREGTLIESAKHTRNLRDETHGSDGKEWTATFDWEENVCEVDDDNGTENSNTVVDRAVIAEGKIKIIDADQPLALKKLDSSKTNYKGQSSGVENQSRSCDFVNGSVTEQTSTNTSCELSGGCANSECLALDVNRLAAERVARGEFSFDYQPDLNDHPGPSPSILLQALTMSNANDGINLERLETIGDSFLKHAITTYLYCSYPNVHEGKLSHLRSKQVSNLKLYRLGRRKGFAHSMVATKFEPNDNWLPPGYLVPKELEQALIDSGIPAGYWNIARLPGLGGELDAEQIRRVLAEHGEELRRAASDENGQTNLSEMTCFIPYNLMTQHSIPDKSIADCVEAQIGAYLTSCGPRGALLFMSWLGIEVLPRAKDSIFGYLVSPPSPIQDLSPPNVENQLEMLLHGYDAFEDKIGYRFLDRSYLLQAFTHASYHYNRLTDCYQRLEFLGDAVLDYLITRHLYEDKRQHSPGTLTDLRSALVNNTIFATLAVRYDFHKYFKALCPNLFIVINRFVRTQKENNHRVSEELYFMEEEECEEVEDIEVPKALGDVFESVAGAIYLDSGMSLDAVWKVYHGIMKSEIELFSTSVPKSPIRELLEKEPETAKFGKPERTLDGKVRVTVEVFGKGRYTALGRNYRIAKCTAAKHALKALRKLQDNPTS